MSGIVALMALDGAPVTGERLAPMLEAIDHRGRDGTGCWRAGSVGLGRHRFITTDDEEREGPVIAASADGALRAVADLRVDNRAELEALLRPSAPRGEAGAERVTDQVLLLCAYQRWGERCVEHLEGDFAFALWDERAARLFCARDHFGVRPLVYCHLPGRWLAVASEAKALLCSGLVAPRLNETKVGDYLAGIYSDQCSTYYQGIWRLPPGHFLDAKRAAVRCRRYWELSCGGESSLPSDAAYAEAFEERFIRAVRRRLRGASFGVGAHLSGGLDSSSVAGVARTLLAPAGRQLHTISAVFDAAAECDERPYIEAFVQHKPPVISHYHWPERRSAFHDYTRLLWFNEGPFWAPHHYIAWGSAEMAAAHGLRLLLDGMDGDATVSHGQGLLPTLVLQGRLATVAAELPAIARRRGIPLRQALRSWGGRQMVPRWFRRAYRHVRGRDPDRIDRTVRPDFVRRHSLRERVAQEAGEHIRGERGEHLAMLRSGAVATALEWIAAVGEAHGVEHRHPYYDRQLIEFCVALPITQKVRDGWTRWVAREALSDYIPAQIRRRGSKTSFDPNLWHLFHNYDRNLLEEVAADAGGPLANYVDLRLLREALSRYYRAGRLADELAVWRAVTLALWLRQLYA